MSRRPSHGELLAEVGREMPGQAGSAARLSIAIAHQLGMALADVQCMGLLTAGPSSPSELAEQLGLTTGAMTKVLDRLQQAGYVTRTADPADRRRITIAADPAGLAELAAYYTPIGVQMSRHLAGYTAAELETILAFIRAGRQAAEGEIARIRREGLGHATRRRRHARPPRETDPAPQNARTWG